MVNFGGFFAKLGHFAGFSLRIYHVLYNAGGISAAAIGTLYFLRGFFFILFAERISEFAMGRTGV